MLELINSEYYHQMSFSIMNNEVKDSDNPKMGHFSGMCCPQCGVKIFANSVGNEWCWNCSWDNKLHFCLCSKPIPESLSMCDECGKDMDKIHDLLDEIY